MSDPGDRESPNPFDDFALRPGASPSSGRARPAVLYSAAKDSKVAKKRRISSGASAGQKPAKGLIEKYRSPGEPEWPLRVIIVGHNPSEKAWELGHYYGNPSNRMWKLLSAAGIVPPNFNASNDDDCPITCGVGFTDVGFSIPGTVSSEFGKKELHSWRSGFYARLLAHAERAAATVVAASSAAAAEGESHANGVSPENGEGSTLEKEEAAAVKVQIEDGYPKVVAFAGKRQWEELFFDASAKVKAQTKGGGKGVFRFGLQPATLRPPGWPFPAGRTELFVVPSSSGAAAMTSEAREGPYRALGDHLSGQEWTRRRRRDGGT
eukprot:g8699.t1